MEKHEEVLVALRQIIRAIDLHSKKLKKECGLTGPQLILMNTIKDMGDVTIRELSNSTNISQATATTIIDRLEAQEYVTRVRSQKDKRKSPSRTDRKRAGSFEKFTSATARQLREQVSSIGKLGADTAFVVYPTYFTDDERR